MEHQFFHPESVWPESPCTVIQTVYGPVLCNRSDPEQAHSLFQTSRAECAAHIIKLCLFLNSVPERGVCLDIGSGYGLFGLAFARAIAPQKGFCHAFEAERMTAYMAAGTAVLNGIENLCVHNQIIGAVAPLAPVGQAEDSQRGESNLASSARGPKGRTRLETTQQTTIDSLTFKNVYLIRSGFNGLQKPVIEGAQATIRRDKPILYISRTPSEEPELSGLCKSLEYDIYRSGDYFLCVHPAKVTDYNVNPNSYGLQECQ